MSAKRKSTVSRSPTLLRRAHVGMRRSLMLFYTKSSNPVGHLGHRETPLSWRAITPTEVECMFAQCGGFGTEL